MLAVCQVSEKIKSVAYQGLWEMFKRIILLVILALGLWSCGDRLDARLASDLNREPTPVTTQALTEVATPSLITELRQELDQYQPPGQNSQSPSRRNL